MICRVALPVQMGPQFQSALLTSFRDASLSIDFSAQGFSGLSKMLFPGVVPEKRRGISHFPAPARSGDRGRLGELSFERGFAAYFISRKMGVARSPGLRLGLFSCARYAGWGKRGFAAYLISQKMGVARSPGLRLGLFSCARYAGWGKRGFAAYFNSRKMGVARSPGLRRGAIFLRPLRGLGLSAASPRTLFLKRVVAICGAAEVVPFQNSEKQPQIPRLRSG